MSMHNNFYYIIMCMFQDTLYTIQVPNVSFIQNNDILIYYIKLKIRLSVCLSVYIFAVMLLTRSSRHGTTQDLVCVIAMFSGTSKFVFINF